MLSHRLQKLARGLDGSEMGAAKVWHARSGMAPEVIAFQAAVQVQFIFDHVNLRPRVGHIDPQIAGGHPPHYVLAVVYPPHSFFRVLSFSLFL